MEKKVKYYDTEDEIIEGAIYFAVESEVLPIAKKQDKYYAHIVMSVADDQTLEIDNNLRFLYLENAIEYCLSDEFYSGVVYSDYRLNKILEINKRL